MHRGRQSGLYIAAAAALLGGYSLGVASTAARSDEDAARALNKISSMRSAPAGSGTDAQQLEKIDGIILNYHATNTVRSMKEKAKAI